MNPVVVLVNTQMPENIGAAARAMMNFGLSEMRLVGPREPFPNKRAYDLAAHAASILDNAKVYETTQEAVADMQRVYASTARPREMVKRLATPAQAAELIKQEAQKTAILFGPERTGLTNEDVTLADTIITIPTAELASLNIAQSVVVVAYQLFQSNIEGAGEASSDIRDDIQLVTKSPFTTKEELKGFFDHLERRLDRVNFWNVDEKKSKMWMNLQNIFTRANLTEQEVRTLHGVIRALAEPQ
ncbi:MAG TPA: RNA methyltransferase [Rickettsiales bacterium]|nr:RNA methyltransferase [Rickettsiales bacterium]